MNAQPGSRDLYDVLGIPLTASLAVLRKAYRNYWNSNPDKLKYLIKWYPHWGGEPLVKDLNTSIQIIQNKARALKLKMLRPRDKRLCYHCQVNYVGKHDKFGQRCTKCFKPHRAEKRRASIHQNPLRGRLRELAYQLYSRNRRKGSQNKISEEALLQLWNRQEGCCVYSGRKMLVSDTDESKRSADTLSVDRVDSRQGYSIDNIVLCTWWTNVAKYDLDSSDFIERCREVVRKAESITQDLETC